VRYSNISSHIQYSSAVTHRLDAGHRWLFEHADILYRDISLDNLMLRKEGGKVYGVLLTNRSKLVQQM
jgi:hypothetical protein